MARAAALRQSPVMLTRIKELRNRIGMPQDELAARAGLSAPYLSQIESGIRNPTLSALAAIAAGLGLHVREIFVPPEPKGFSEMTVEPLAGSPSLPPHIAQFRVRGRRGSAFGYPPGAVLLVDLNANPSDGDAVVAQREDPATGGFDTIMGRVFRGCLIGGDFLIDPTDWLDLGSRELVIRGVVRGSMAEPEAA